MAYRWKPSASQRRAFAEKMKDPAEQAAYEERKAAKADKRRAGSKFDYPTAGGMYVPTSAQHDYACFDRSMNTTPEHDMACDMVASAYTCQEKVHHDHIHIVNELIRAKVFVSHPRVKYEYTIERRTPCPAHVTKEFISIEALTAYADIEEVISGIYKVGNEAIIIDRKKVN